jgi:hypothetical protein
MESSLSPLPAELRRLIQSRGPQPLRLIDDQTQKIYLVIEQKSYAPVDDAYLRRLLEEADEDIRNGDVADWDIEEVEAEARKLFAERRAIREQ